ncbi:MAG TPA: S9 family peptidase [Streptosporangiaceae bacterium]|nr:S9 family peptidase [Streptosporangiaceae bacterium]
MSQFDDFRDYLAIPAVTGLCLSPDGSWLAATVQGSGPEPKKLVTSIWRIDTGHAPAARLTRSAEGESAPAFLADGSLLFASRRPVPGARQAGDTEGSKAALWLLPPGGGEARRVAGPPGGITSVATARTAQRYLAAVPAFAGTSGPDEDAARRKARADAGVSAILHETGLVRYWDHDLGPDCLRLLTAEVAAGSGDDAGAADLRDLTPDAGRALDEQVFCLAPDGSVAVTGWLVPEKAGGTRTELAVIDLATAQRRTLLGASGADFSDPAISPDGQIVVAIRSEHDTYQRPGDVTLVTAPLDADSETQPRDLLPGFDRRPLTVAWSPDSRMAYFTADDNGRCPVFAVRLDTGDVMKVTTDDAAYDSLCPAPDGRALYALRASISEPPAAVRIDVSEAGTVPAWSEPVRLPGPGGGLQVPGRVEEVTADGGDGITIRGWLVLPEGASAKSPAPVLLWVHGGPVMSWNSWSWRWNPWLMAARGYAVLLPDPALSTGYGQDFIGRGHGSWGDKPFADVMAITDAVMAREDLDQDRTAMMGGSFGGYMANWIAGHTTRFRAIVSHAGVWALDQMLATTDDPPFWYRMFGRPDTEPERYLACSPHLHADKISTPVLIIHGDRDYRVPVGEALRMYSDLSALGKRARFLYFPDENHWILKPGDVRVWYESIFAFLAENVLGEAWHRPDLL